MALDLTRRSFVTLCATGAAALGISGVALAADKGSSSADAAASAASDGSVRTVTDMNGNEVSITLKGDVARVVTCNSVATQMVLMLGGEQAAATVGQGFVYDEGSLNQKMYPGLADVKTFTRDDCTVENVAVLDPDFVIIDVPDTVAALADAGIPALTVGVNSPETIMQAMQVLGQAMGDEPQAKAEEYCTYYQQVLDDTAAASEGVADDAKPRVIYLSSQTGTSGANSMADSWITTCGCVNVAAEMGLEGSRAEATVEGILAADPEIIVVERASVAEELMADAAWSEVTAIKNGMVLEAPLAVAVWSMGSPDAPLMVRWAAANLNPDLYPDVDVDAETAEFYEKYYGYELAQEDLDGIFHREA